MARLGRPALLGAALGVALAAGGCGVIDFASQTQIGGADARGGDAALVDGAGVLGPPSCQALPTKCGQDGGQSCCDSAVVPASTFFRSFDLAGDLDSGDETAPATVSAFRLDRYEVTVGRFRAFLDAGGGVRQGAPALGAGGRRLNGMDGVLGWDATWTAELLGSRAALDAALACDPTFATWTPMAASNEARPINCLTWFEAQAFCVWDGGYLPTDAEWNAAAAGGDEQRALPWSVPAGSLVIDPSYASYWSMETQCTGSANTGCDVEDLMRVGSRPAGNGRWGHADLGGNVWEWVADSYESVYPSGACVDCAVTIGRARSTRGGGFFDAVQGLRTGLRDAQEPEGRFGSRGARCARGM